MKANLVELQLKQEPSDMCLKRQIFGQGVAELLEITTATLPFYDAFCDAVEIGYKPVLSEWTTAIGFVCKQYLAL